MIVTDIQRFCMHDGPGVRTTVFLKGCPLRCVWCHNPETQHNKSEILFYQNKCILCGECAACGEKAHVFSGTHDFVRGVCVGCGACAAACPTNALELIGKEYTPEQLIEIVEKDRAFYGENGGVTLSGGEPFAQGEDAIRFLRLCKEAGLHTAVETCGYTSESILARAASVTDLFLWDLKDTDPYRHKKNTGVSNEKIISNLLFADSLGANTRLRCILISGINTDAAHYQSISELAARLKHCQGVELIPYHSYGDAKSAALGRELSGNDEWIPSKEQMEDAKKYLQSRGIAVQD